MARRNKNGGRSCGVDYWLSAGDLAQDPDFADSRRDAHKPVKLRNHQRDRSRMSNPLLRSPSKPLASHSSSNSVFGSAGRRQPAAVDNYEDHWPRPKIYDSDFDLPSTIFRSSDSTGVGHNTKSSENVTSASGSRSREMFRWSERTRSLNRSSKDDSGGGCSVLAWLNLMGDCDNSSERSSRERSSLDGSNQLLHPDLGEGGNVEYDEESGEYFEIPIRSGTLPRASDQRIYDAVESKPSTTEPFIQSNADQQVLLGSVEPVHVSHAMRTRHHVFHCYEFLLLKRLNSDPQLWSQLCDKFGVCNECVEGLPTEGSERACGVNSFNSADFISQKDLFLSLGCSSSSQGAAPGADLWFLGVALRESKDKLIHFVRNEFSRRGHEDDDEYSEDSSVGPRTETESLPVVRSSFLASYLNSFNFVELRLDNILEKGSNLPKEIFRCPNVKVLSLRSNHLETISPEIGRMSRLERLYLTHNLLKNHSIPFTLAFCRRLREAYFDNNQLDALPSVLLQLPSLERVYRHGNHNYFKATFMFYHTDIHDRILINPARKDLSPMANTLQVLAAKATLSSQINFYLSPSLPPATKDYLTSIAEQVELCNNCAVVQHPASMSFKVYTFKNPYLGNTCVPFQHVACSSMCARAIEIPARKEQKMCQLLQDWEYDQYVQESLSSLQNDERSPHTSSSSLRRRGWRTSRTESHNANPGTNTSSIRTRSPSRTSSLANMTTAGGGPASQPPHLLSSAGSHPHLLASTAAAHSHHLASTASSGGSSSSVASPHHAPNKSSCQIL